MNPWLPCLFVFVFVCSGLPAEEVGKQAAEMLTLALTKGSCVDDNLQDQVVVVRCH